MGRQNDDSNMVNSSMALLQERFRKLQRIREKRQEKEILKLFSSNSERVAPAMHFEASKLLNFQPEMILPNRPSTPQDSFLSLGHNSPSNKHPDFPSSLWPNTGNSSSSRNFENSDVDTSLHL